MTKTQLFLYSASQVTQVAVRFFMAYGFLIAAQEADHRGHGWIAFGLAMLCVFMIVKLLVFIPDLPSTWIKNFENRFSRKRDRASS